MKEAYFTSMKKNLPVYGVPEKNLSDYTTNKKDVKNSQSRVPTLARRL
jgi:hypothetical protein